jgi:hypothetical protein
MSEDHSWIYTGWDKGVDHSDEWMTKATMFLDRAFSRTKMVWCPCDRCQNTRRLDDKRMMVVDLCKYSFLPGYEVWTFHIEKATQAIEEEEPDYNVMGVDRMDKMLDDIQLEILEDPPTIEVEVFFKLLKALEESLQEHTEVTLLAIIIRIMIIKSKYFFSNNCYNDLIKLTSEAP